MPKLYKNVVLWDAERESASLCDVLTEGAEIAKIAPAGTLDGEAAFDGRGGTAMLPGFVNAHGHAAMTMLRGLGEELPLMEWLQKKIWPVENKLDAETAYIGAQLALMEMLSTGTTCFADMYFFMDSVAEAVLAGGMRAGLSRGIVPSQDGGRERLDENLKLARDYDGANGLIHVQLGPHAPYTVPTAFMTEIAAAAKENGLGVQLHIVGRCTQSHCLVIVEEIRIVILFVVILAPGKAQESHCRECVYRKFLHIHIIGSVMFK